MKIPCVLLSGSSVYGDDNLAKELQNIVDIIRNKNNYNIETILKQKKIDLILMEITNDYRPSEIEIIKIIKEKYPNIKIVLINGNGNKEAIARAFAHGVKDLFRKPYKRNLIVDRIVTLLSRKH